MTVRATSSLTLATASLRGTGRVRYVPDLPQRGTRPHTETGESVGRVADFIRLTGIEGPMLIALHGEVCAQPVAALTLGVAQLAVERTQVLDLDRQLQSEYANTIGRVLKNRQSRAALLVLGEQCGESVAAAVVIAGMGAITRTTVELIKDERCRSLYRDDPTMFGLELATHGGRHFGGTLLHALATANAGKRLPHGLRWLAGFGIVQRMLGVPMP